MTSHVAWGERTPATEVAQTFSDRIKDKVVLITGISPTSLGESLARAFSQHSPSLLILASRTPSKIQAVASTLPSTCPTTIIQLDLSSEPSIRSAVTAIKEVTDHIDILINNAGVVLLEPSWNDQGIETGFYTNHLGPFLFTNLLLPLLLKSATLKKSSDDDDEDDISTRIVNVTSQGHRISPIRFSDPNFHTPSDQLPPEEQPAPYAVSVFKPKPPHTGYSWGYSYGQSKTANVLFSHALNYRFADDNLRDGSGDSRDGGRGGRIVSVAVHPGSIWTDLSRHLDQEALGIIEKTGGYWKTLDEGSATTMVVALDPKIGRREISSDGKHANGGDSEGGRTDGDGDAGKGEEVGYRRAFMSDCQFIEEAPHARGREMSDRLWKLSEEMLGEKFEW